MELLNLSGDLVTAKGATCVEITSNIDDRVTETVDAYIVPTLLGSLPKKRIDIIDWNHIRDLKLADPQFNVPDRVDILLGAAFYSRIIMNGIRRRSGAPTAQRTTFGWIVFGNHDSTIEHASIVNVIEGMVTNDELLEMLTRFWERDQVPEKEYRTQEHELCEKIFIENIKVDKDGRYVARMPVQPNAPKVTDTYELALGRLLQMERRFKKDPELKAKYISFMGEYTSLGHMDAVPIKEQRSDKAVYIPHHAAGTSKFRVVFDGSCKKKGGVSINDIQLNGEKIQPESISTLMRFRMHKIALTADIAKMYRQIRIAEDQRDLQRILWRESLNQPVAEYRLMTQTYGMKSAAYVCIRSLDHCADEFAKEFPEASKTVKQAFYVDDMLGGSNTVESAIRLHNDLTTMLGKRKLELAKWGTNSPEVHQYIKSTHNSLIELNKEESNAVLGMHWCPSNDDFLYKIRNPVKTTNATKRTVASDIARLYDPCGYLACVIVLAKVMLQDLWRSNVGWDDEISGEVARKWSEFGSKINNIEQLRIPRWINTDLDAKKQLHAFADASLQSYGCAFYVRQENENHSVSTNLVFAKSKVAPVKGSTIPKLELSACHLMAELADIVRKAHDIEMSDCYFWSDSMIAIHWIAKSPVTLDVFVANRVGSIQELTKGAEWRHVDTKSNPADIVSRGICPSKIAQCQLWWKGSPWLILAKEKWPKSKLVLTEADQTAIRCHERKSAAVVNAAVCEEGPIANKGGNLVNRYSSWLKLTRVTAYVLRFINNTRANIVRCSGELEADELVEAELVWLKYSQRVHFNKEIKALASGQPVDKGSALAKLVPFAAEKGVLRLAGRIKRSNMPYDTVHPIVLSSKCQVSKLIIQYAHKATLHGGTQQVQQYIRQRYWIIGGRCLVKTIASHCLPCIRQRKTMQTQIMAHLPENRVRPGRAFESTAVDYAGPISLKRYNAKRTKIIDKGYIAVFVCTRIRAVHLELVSDLSTEAFEAALIRFSGSRGMIREMVSDNATTFHGADSHAQEIFATWQKASTGDLLRGYKTKWRFLPPLAPHMGGLHEAAVKSAKLHLRRVIGAQQLTYEEMSTLLKQVEACLNSRPLMALTEDANDSLALTPGHFLIGEPLISPLTRDYRRTARGHLSHFKLIVKMAQEFWERWSDEYVTSLMERGKWNQEQPNLKVGDIVLMSSETLAPTQWPLGKITEVFPDKDGQIRIVDVLSKGNTYRRPITKLCRLPTSPGREDVQD